MRPAPLEHEAANPLRGNYYCVYKNVFAMIFDFDVVEGNSLHRKAITTTHSQRSGHFGIAEYLPALAILVVYIILMTYIRFSERGKKYENETNR